MGATMPGHGHPRFRPVENRSQRRQAAAMPPALRDKRSFLAQAQAMPRLPFPAYLPYGWLR
jgi:hypothetical protein